MLFLNTWMQIPLRLQGSSGQGSWKLTQPYMKSLNHLRGKSTTELITHGESPFSMEVCSLLRQLSINSRSGRQFSFKTLFLFSKYIKNLHIGNVGSAPNFSGKYVSTGNLGFKMFIQPTVLYELLKIWIKWLATMDMIAPTIVPAEQERHELTLCEIQVW